MSEKRRLLLITRGFPYDYWEVPFIGSEVAELSRHFDLFILSCGSEEKQAYYNLEPDVHCERFKWKKNYIHIIIAALSCSFISECIKLYKNRAKICGLHGSTNFKTAVKDFLRKNAYALQVMPHIRSIIKTHRIDIVYTYWCSYFTYASVWLKKDFPDIKVVCRFHSDDLYINGTDCGYQLYRELLNNNLDELYFVSEHGRDYYADLWKRYGKVSYLGSPAFHRIETDYTDRFVLISCSVFKRRKRVELIIEALSLIPDTYSIEWHHFGSGNRKEKLEETARKILDNKANIEYRFEGGVENSGIMLLYESLKPSLFISTSLLEGLPVSMCEALSGGIPLMGPASYGIPEVIIDGETGVLLPADPTPQEIADEIMKYYDLPVEEKMRMSRNCMNLWTEKFDAVKNAKEFVKELMCL